MACQGLDVHRLREVTMKGGNEVTIRGQRKNCKYAFPTAELPERIGDARASAYQNRICWYAIHRGVV
jgi:hypothetical protein